MGILRLQTTNKNIGFLIKKNPHTGMNIEKLRKGTLFGYYNKNNKQEYIMYFKDNLSEVSYDKHNNGYNDTSQFISPVMYINMLDSIKGGKLEDGEYSNEGTHTLTIGTLYIARPKLIRTFEKSFPQIEFNFQEEGFKLYKVTLEHIGKLSDFLNLVDLFLVYNSVMATSDSYFITDDAVVKYLKTIVEQDIDYSFRAMFKNNFIKNKKLYYKVLDDLNKSSKQDLFIEYGNTHEQRQKHIKKEINLKNPVVDIGAGEGVYAVPYAKEMLKKDIPYFAIDIDERMQDRLEHKKKINNLKNLSVFSSVNNYLKETDINVEKTLLMTEVIEHMEESEALSLLTNVINQDNFSQIIITTPNKEFNQFYKMEEAEMRHDDHHFEPTRKEFEDFIGNLLSKLEKSYEVDFNGIGDIVNNTQTSSIAVLTKNKN